MSRDPSIAGLVSPGGYCFKKEVIFMLLDAKFEKCLLIISRDHVT